MKKLSMFLIVASLLLFSLVTPAQTSTTESDKEGYYLLTYNVASIDSAGADTSGFFGMNQFLTGSSLYTYPFNFWYNITVAGSGEAVDTVLMTLIFDGHHNDTWVALDSVTLDISGTSGTGVQLMNLNNWRSPNNKYRIRATQDASGSPVTDFKCQAIFIKPTD